MKTVIGVLLTLTLWGSTVQIACAQGSVNFANRSFSSTWISTNSVSGGPATGYILGPVGSYYFALFVATPDVTSVTSLDPTESGFSFTGYIGTNRTAGRFSGNPSTDDVIIYGYPQGASLNFIVTGWSGNIGNNWAAAQSWLRQRNADGYYGQSSVATSVATGGGIVAPGEIFGIAPGQIPGFTLGYSPLPEPSTAALLALAGIFRAFLKARKRFPKSACT